MSMEFETFDSRRIEQAIIGAILLESSCICEAEKIITPGDFSVDEYREIYNAASELSAEGETADYITVSAALRNRGADIDKQVLLTAIDVVPYAGNISRYCAELKDKAQRRRLYGLSREIMDALGAGKDVFEILADTTQAIDAATGAGVRRDTAKNADLYALIKHIESPNKAAFVSTGYTALDRILGGGMLCSGLYIIAARPGVGKTTLALSIAGRAAARGVPVLFVSMEMSAEQIGAKRLSAALGVKYIDILKKGLEAEQMVKAAETLSKLGGHEFYSLYGRRTIKEIQFEARRIKNLGLLVIDYLGIIKPREGDTRTRYDIVTEHSAALKGLAVSLGIPVLCLSQLNRESEKDKDKRPRLSHLRDSGAIEQDADGIILLQRIKSEEQGKSAIPQAETLNVYIDKNRHGETGELCANWYGGTGEIRFRGLS